MNNTTKEKWDEKYLSCSSDYPEPAVVLSENQHLLPSSGKALDLACGRGANALCLAENKLDVSAWDISSVALECLIKQARTKNLEISCDTRDVSINPPEDNSFDIIVVSRFLDRSIIDDIKDAVRLNGLVFYQTFTKEKVNSAGPSNPDYLLEKNELLEFFDDWQIIFYREESSLGKLETGYRNEAMLIAKKIKT